MAVVIILKRIRHECGMVEKRSNGRQIVHNIFKEREPADERHQQQSQAADNSLLLAFPLLCLTSMFCQKKCATLLMLLAPAVADRVLLKAG